MGPLRHKRVLLINPWIYDFAAYDLWVKPLGLLRLGRVLRNAGYEVFLIDCLDHYSPWVDISEIPGPRRKIYHCGKFRREAVNKPLPLKWIPRTFSRYGISEKAFWSGLHHIGRPDVILVTSCMTYWYPGPFRAIEIARTVFPEVPVILGGIYATLCHEHAVMYSRADHVYSGSWLEGAVALVNRILHQDFELKKKSGFPCFDLYPILDAVCIRTSQGCPYRCTYCASGLLEEGFSQRSSDDVVEEILHWSGRFHVKDIAFYDDALLADAGRHIIPILERIIQKGIRCRFHAPNGIHAGSMTMEIAELMFLAGFKTIRLGLETIDAKKQIETGGKTRNEDVQKAIECLQRAKFSSRDIGVYVLAGLPGQHWKEVEHGMARIWQWGGVPKIAEYSPIPHTALWEEAVRNSPYDLRGEPLLQNNSILPCRWEGFTWEDLTRMKGRLQQQIRKETPHG